LISFVTACRGTFLLYWSAQTIVQEQGCSRSTCTDFA
jgi:hypothetical protein